MTGSKKVFVKTYGCQMNVYDSERMAQALAPEGYIETSTIEEADLIVLNTCHIREKAAEKVYSELGRLRELKSRRSEAGRDTVITVAGCVAQAEGAEITRRAPVVDLVVGPQSYHRLPDLLARVRGGGPRVVETGFPADTKFGRLPERAANGAVSAFVTVQEGCDKFCTFCVVPYTRGAEYSRPVADLESEVRRLTDQGVREITLLGQNVNAYSGAGPDGHKCSLAELMDRLGRNDRLARIRYTTSHPTDMDEDLIAAHRDNPKLMPYLHLPIQSGSDRILAAMNRKHTVAEYLVIIDRVRTVRSDLALSTDIIVGFPGETEAEFTMTLELVERVGFAQAYAFKYSPRPGTPAAELPGEVAETVKTQRLHRLQALLLRQQTAFNTSMVGRTLPVLFERKGRHPGQLIGRSPYLQAVHASAPDWALGTVMEVEIGAIGPNSLSGAVQMTPAIPA